ncbi:hypothetical protein WG909_12900 [Peptostreptococcaceae bacterium AGR-M142]
MKYLALYKQIYLEDKKDLIEDLGQKSEIINKAIKRLIKFSVEENQRQEYLAREKILKDKANLKKKIEETSEELNKLKEKNKIE